MPELTLWWAPIPGTAQEAFFDDDTPEANLLFTGGWGSGKTMTLTAKMLKLSAINAPLPILWIVPDWAHVKDTVIPTIEDLDPETGHPWFLRPDQYHYHQTEHTLTWLDGAAKIQFASAENPDSIAGPNMAGMGTDEPGSIKHKAWRNGVARVRHPRAALRQKVAGGTPEGLGWLMDMFGDPERPENYKVYRMRTEENTEMLKRNPGYLDQVRENATDAEIASYLGGQFVNLTGALAYPMFDVDRHWRPEVTLLPKLPLHLTFDFNVDPMSCIAAQVVSGPAGPELRVVHTFALYGGSTVDQTCDAILERWPTWTPGVFIYGDATGRNRSVTNLKGNYGIILERLKPMGRLELKVPTANPPVTDRLSSVNRLLKNALGVTRLYVAKTGPGRLCPNRELVKSLQKTQRKPGTDDIWKKPGETISHAADALGYLIHHEWPVQKPRVSTGAVWMEHLL